MNNTLFAPQVEAVQPAFIYNEGGEVKIYYSFSAYNNNATDKSSVNKIGCKIVDPNLESGWGTNSMITGQEYLKISATNGEKGNYITVLFNSSNSKTFSLNQYYQVQIVFLNASDEEISPWSQITLIRPISEPVLTINQKDKTGDVLNEISGSITGEEPIKSYSFSVINSATGIEIYKSKTFYNTLGTNFYAIIEDCYLPGGEYTINFIYTTLNGYKKAESVRYTISEDAEAEKLDSNVFLLDPAAAAIHISFNPELTGNGPIEILRSSFEYDYLNWQSVLKVASAPLDYEIKWSDYTVENGVLYKYKIKCGTNIFKSEPISIEYEDIFLGDASSQLAIRFDPNISGVKWVTQESFTNTLGGKFPITRINGDTKYKQFSISGLLYSNEEILNNIENKDSLNRDLTRWFSVIEQSFYSTVESKRRALSITNKILFEKYFRDEVIEFLTNQSPKLFRSPTEGNSLVYLSNISFTPNQTLGRNVYSFSATATEIDFCTISNLKKYNLLYSFNLPLFTYYTLTAGISDGEEKNGYTYLTPIVNENLISNNDTLTLQEHSVRGE